VEDDDPSPAEKTFFAKFDAALDTDGRPSSSEISRCTRDVVGKEVPEPTIRGWIEKASLPRSNDDFMAVLKALGAERQELDWLELLRAARRSRQVRLSSIPDQEPSPGDEILPIEPTPSSQPVLTAATPEHRGQTEIRIEDGPAPASSIVLTNEAPKTAEPPLHRQPIVMLSLGALTLTVIVLAAVIWHMKHTDDPQRQCATVIAASAPVYAEIGQPLLKEKKRGEQVEFYQALKPTRGSDGTYRAVLLREGGAHGFGWMLESQLEAASCNVK
jgi:hypothetical protein